SANTVKSGDTVSVIAARYGVSVADIVTANKLRSAGVIYVGQRLVIQRGAAASAGQPAGSAGSGGSGPAPAGSATTGSRYVIRSGDTISAIAAHYHVTIAALLKANALSMSSIIYPGQALKIPSLIIDGLTAEQSANVRTIVAVGRSLGVPDRGIEIALGTAMTESGLRNLNYGDRDSLGLFQQRPSTGWGTKAQILDPVSSTTAFFVGRGHATRGLLDIKGWQQMPFTKAAQAVQVSAFPNAYAPWEKPSARWLAAAD
ncbi:MAG TPA: LysM peptidoglycan-binding domain-containing protein, partial [Microbacterium sp.]|uniref:LysM peptidoglycan-binding domain-containing protein n=1 Tax=Microbacterium sp. TaxID=51671 RepID=UPI002B4689F5